MLTVVMFYVLVMVTAVMFQILVNSHVNICTLSGTDDQPCNVSGTGEQPCDVSGTGDQQHDLLGTGDQPCGISVLVISHVMFQVLVIWLLSAGSCGCLC